MKWIDLMINISLIWSCVDKLQINKNDNVILQIIFPTKEIGSLLSFTYDKEKTMQVCKTWFCLSSKFWRKTHTGSQGTMHYVVSITSLQLYDLYLIMLIYWLSLYKNAGKTPVGIADIYSNVFLNLIQAGYNI